MTNTIIKPKALSLLLALTLILLSVTPVLAAEGDQTVPVDLTVEAPIFAVTVPIALPILPYLSLPAWHH